MDKKVEFKRECVVGRVAKSIRVNADTIIHIGPCLLTGIVIGNAGGNTWAKIYDGLNTNGELKYQIHVTQRSNFHRELVYPVDFDEGIYVDVNDTDTHLTIEYIPESRKSYW